MSHAPSMRPRRRPNRAAPIVVLIVVAALPALGLWSIAEWADAKTGNLDSEPVPETTAPVTSTAPLPALSTNLLSLRRTAGQMSLNLNLASFETAVAPFAAAVPERSCMAMSLNGRRVGEARPDQIVIPASNQKILVAAVALDTLGDDFRYETRLVGPAPVDGTITGDVYLIGGGDPLLSGEWYEESNLDYYPAFNTTPIDELARQLSGAGVTQIEGRVVGDGSRYDDEYYVSSWLDGVAGVEAGPYDALVVNDARIRNDDQRASDPVLGGAQEFVRILAENGITVSGGAGTGTAPADAAALATIQSAPLPAIVEEMLTNSDNNTAELMVKEIGYQASGLGTRQAGLDVIAATISGWGIPIDGMVLGDGSGLSLDNRISCTTMLGVLEHYGMNTPLGAGMAVAGESGTLSDIFGDTPVAGRLRAKTGTLNNPPYDQDPPAVKALSGYVDAEGDQIAFTLILNDNMISDQSEYRPIWAELVTAVAAYPAVANPAALGPR